MSQAYTPSLQVTEHCRIVKIRELPLPGKCLVKPGQQVKAHTPVLSAELPGDLTIVHLAERIGFDPVDVAPGMKVKVGEAIQANVLLCEVKSFFGLFCSQVKSPASGTVEFFTEANAHLGIRHAPVPLSVNAYLDGVVCAIEEGKSVTIETDGALIQGIFGVGGERQGEILALNVSEDAMVEPFHLQDLKHELQGKIIIGGAAFSPAALREAATAGATAVVTGSIDAAALAGFAGKEISVSVTGDEDVPFTLIVTEGFGRLTMSSKVSALAKKLHAQKASVNGATQVRAGATRPEIIVSHAKQEELTSISPLSETKSLEIGAPVRIIRVPYFGRFGTVSSLPSSPQIIPSGALVRVLGVCLDDGSEAIVPRANVELV